ncbi:MAG: hypothetical protein AMXMBFR7_04410 [Planctomycetota bacterium]
MLLAMLLGSGQAQAQLVNGSFETGNFKGWILEDLTSPYRAHEVARSGVQDDAFSSFVSAPTHGKFAALNGFDGSGPGTISLSQDIRVPNQALLTFDYRAGWDLVPYGATQDRTFSLNIEPWGGGAPLATFPLLTAQAGTNVNDTGPQQASIDLSGFAKQRVRIRFVEFVPESFTGPGLLQLDNVVLEVVQNSFVEAETGDALVLTSLDYTLNWPKAPGSDSFIAKGIINLSALVETGAAGNNQQLQGDVGSRGVLPEHPVLLDLFTKCPVSAICGGVFVEPAPTPKSVSVAKVVWRSLPGAQPFVQIEINPSTGAFTVTVKNADLTLSSNSLQRYAGSVFSGLNGASAGQSVSVDFELFLGGFDGFVNVETIYQQTQPNTVGKGSFRLPRDEIDFGKDSTLFFVDRLTVTEKNVGGLFVQKADAHLLFKRQNLATALSRDLGFDPLTNDVAFAVGGYVETIPAGGFTANAAGTIFTYGKPAGNPPGIASVQINCVTAEIKLTTDFLDEGLLGIPHTSPTPNDTRTYLTIPVTMEFVGDEVFEFQALTGRQGTTFKTGAPGVLLTPLLVED